MARHQELREDPRYITAFLMAKILTIHTDTAKVNALRREDFVWPDRDSIVSSWMRSLNDPELVRIMRGDLDIDRMFEDLSI